jgi:hypothetical protein
VIGLERGEDGGRRLTRDGIPTEDFVDLFGFVVGAVDDFILLAG